MNTQNTVEQLKTLKLRGMAKRYEAALALPVHELQDVHALIGMITQAEVEYAIMPAHKSTSKQVSYATMQYLRIYSAAQKEVLQGNRYFGFPMGFSLKKARMYSLQVLQDVENPFSPVPWDAVPVCWATERSTSA